jgi:hypothetical protein
VRIVWGGEIFLQKPELFEKDEAVLLTGKVMKAGSMYYMEWWLPTIY